ncbi:MAG: hypothetical protein FD180_2917 [Planctomycetota bacterium]|nr:MAG: hypothetical protein FD180_2917 [Planctomycetota bacterium]
MRRESRGYYQTNRTLEKSYTEITETTEDTGNKDC